MMATVDVAVIACDSCGLRFERRYVDLDTVRAESRQAGWGDRWPFYDDLCPECADRIDAAEEHTL